MDWKGLLLHALLYVCFALTVLCLVAGLRGWRWSIGTRRVSVMGVLGLVGMACSLVGVWLCIAWGR